VSDRSSLLFLEDFHPGDIREYGAYPVTRDEIVAFAAEFDPQPFHLDEAAARRSLLGGLAASGWHTCAMMMRLNCEGFLLRSAALGAPGIDEVKWLRPVRPGDVLRVRSTVVDARPSRSRPEKGIARFVFDLLNQRGETVASQKNVIMFRCRKISSEPARTERETSAPALGPEPERSAQARPVAAGDGYMVGLSEEIGAHTFTAEDMVRFARRYDPQPFHLDDDAARDSPFGRLAASGWQTASIWMREFLAWSERMTQERRAHGQPIAVHGPSPGFRDLKWLRPVHAGDTITYRTQVSGRRASASRPGWDLLFTRNTGVNQAGTLVFEFSGTSFLASAG
jgi:acyl dehydratase